MLIAERTFLDHEDPNIPSLENLPRALVAKYYEDSFLDTSILNATGHESCYRSGQCSMSGLFYIIFLIKLPDGSFS
jgi:hypothetical protein